MEDSRIAEANFDGLVGLTHNYAGLASGNIASQANRRKPANPRQAALQGLEKMRLLASKGLRQALLPPLARPDIDWLRSLGFSGKDAAVLDKVAKQSPVLLAACYSASSMWAANAATFTPSSDSGDGKAHITPANLSHQIHRSLEPSRTMGLLRRVFPGGGFVHHPPLPSGRFFSDEGAANHTRLAPSHGAEGIGVFAYGHDPLRLGEGMPRVHAPRQSRQASEAVARSHGLQARRSVFLKQNPAAIDAGVFHNDVIAVGNRGLFLCHELAFENQGPALRRLRRAYADLGGGRLQVIEVTSAQVTLAEAVSTYLFNSQILSLPGGQTLLLAAAECRENERVHAYLTALAESGCGIDAVEFVDLRQSMRNGGGPACLRLRAALTRAEWEAVPAGIRFDRMDGRLYGKVKAWVEKHYRDRLSPRDLADPELLKECRAAAVSLDRLLGLPTG